MHKTVLDFGDKYLHPISSLAFSPDGTLITGTQKSHFTLWDIHSNKLLHTEHGLAKDSVVAQSWSPDGLNTVFASGWTVTVKLDPKMTINRYHQSTLETVDLASVDSTGMRKAVAVGGNVSIWSRALGQEQWVFQENLTVPTNLEKSRPMAKSIYWCDYPDPQIIVIYGNLEAGTGLEYSNYD
ncbi:hypothetical protein B0H15DRAFT_957273 [Mycena belliarum]|uniref:Translation initiation factor beta propellor-like domain-containing protein n=1 Tax=Mycena belliarum TaxID=1033014 RepID=A0AAD6XEG9_9AGAR|nr:hypothetical protein B0H15DRAFT_957273 [Mycena belliae]